MGNSAKKSPRQKGLPGGGGLGKKDVPNPRWAAAWNREKKRCQN